jgi:hypothetical protein
MSEPSICTVGGGVKPTLEANPTSGEVGCRPFQSNSLEVRRENGVAIPNQRNVLTGLEVLFGTDKIQAGSTVYFEGDQCATVWAKRVYTIGDQKFILAPVNLIKVVERKWYGEG